jgi:Flp pilus assembly pilin Flp
MASVEYALLLVLIVIVGMTAWKTLGIGLAANITRAANAIP